MQVVILCGGLGTRLFPLTNEIPKCMLQVKGKPVLEHQIEYLRNEGISDIYLAVGYLKEQIIDYFGDGHKFNVNIKYIEDDCEGTGGALRGIKNLNSNMPIFVLNGDTILSVSLKEMLQQHKKEITIAVAKVSCSERYGVIIDGILQEKVKVDNADVSIGLYIISPSVLDLIHNSGFCSLEKDIFPKVEQGFYKYNGDWFDMGTIESYEEVR